MRRFPLLALAIFAAVGLRAAEPPLADFQWTLPANASVPSGQAYTVEWNGGTSHSTSTVTIYKNSYYFASGNGHAEGTTTDFGAQSVAFLGEFHDPPPVPGENGLTGLDTRSVTVTAPTTAPTVTLTDVPNSVALG